MFNFAARRTLTRLSLQRYSAMSTSTSTESGPIERSIREKVVYFDAQTIPVMTEIAPPAHRHHAPMRESGGGNGETHFSLKVVSDEFKGKSTMQRHRLVYGLLAEEFAAGLHALSIHTKTVEEVQTSPS